MVPVALDERLEDSDPEEEELVGGVSAGGTGSDTGWG